MPQTPRGITYPDSSGSTQLWTHFQDLADTTDAAIDATTPADSGWITVPNLGTSGTVQYRIKAGVVYIKMAVIITCASGANTNVVAAGGLPVEARPATDVIVGAHFGNGYAGAAYVRNTGLILGTHATGANRTGVYASTAYPQDT